MLFQKYLWFLFLNFFFVYSIHCVKQFVDFEDYTDMEAGNVIIDESPNITYICGENIKSEAFF